MTEHYPSADESGQSAARDTEFHDRLMRFSQEAIATITPETEPRKVWAVLWALDGLMYDYADAPHGFKVDPSTANEIGSVILDLFGNFTGLSHLPEDEVQAIRGEGGDLVRRYFQGFPTQMSGTQGEGS